MRTPTLIAILVLASASLALAQNTGKASSSAAKRVHIISPAPDQSVEGTSVSIRYELSSHRRASARVNFFRIELDSLPPVETAETAYTFNNVTPGPHTVSVELIDAKNRPVAASQAISTFIVWCRR
jgi:hypothetical protein